VQAPQKLPSTQTGAPPAQLAHAAPLLPQVLLAVPAVQVPPLQQPPWQGAVEEQLRPH
jgi:hypothetical protein